VPLFNRIHGLFFMEKDAIRRGAAMGAVIAFWMAMGIPFLFIVSEDYRVVGEFRFWVDLFAGGACYSLIFAGIGYVFGNAGANCLNVRSAFWRGAKISAIIAGSFIPGILLICLLSDGPIDCKNIFYFFLTFISPFMLVTSFGTLISGLSAIYARDYREFQRKRFIPQFTLIELLIVVTLFAIIISSLVSIESKISVG
jgi:hypothetical protein